MKGIIIGVSSDIGDALCNDWLSKHWQLSGTYRSTTDSVIDLADKLHGLIFCDLKSIVSIDMAAAQLNELVESWDVLVFGPGLQEPISPFEECNFEDWADSINVNFTNQLRLLHRLLPNRNKNSKNGSTVLFFAGGGVNNAPVNYSAYISSKIALVKMVELLAAEIEDTKFLIIGPGWVKTKIHKSMLNSNRSGDPGYERTLQRFKDDDFVSMDRVINCCNTLINEPCKMVSGRNFSVEFDAWDNQKLYQALENDQNMYKLRRAGNDTTIT